MRNAAMRPPASVAAEKPSQSPSVESRRAGAVNASAPTPTFALIVGFTYQGIDAFAALATLAHANMTAPINALLSLIAFIFCVPFGFVQDYFTSMTTSKPSSAARSIVTVSAPSAATSNATGLPVARLRTDATLPCGLKVRNFFSGFRKWR